MPSHLANPASEKEWCANIEAAESNPTAKTASVAFVENLLIRIAFTPIGYSQRNTLAESAVQITNTRMRPATSPACASHDSPFQIPSRSETA